MSVAARFKHPRAFPFCLSNEVPEGHDYVGGLTLAQIMKVWWSLEEVGVAVTGDPNGGILADINITLTAPPDVASVPLVNSFIDSGDTSVPRAPNSRACVTSDYAVSFSYSDEYAPSVPREMAISIKVIIDPDNSANYALAYKITAECRSEFDSGAVITSPADGAARFTGTPEFTGTIDFGGIEFDWVGGPVFYLTAAPENTGSWQTGGTDFAITVTPSFFTYP